MREGCPEVLEGGGGGGGLNVQAAIDLAEVRGCSSSRFNAILLLISIEAPVKQHTSPSPARVDQLPSAGKRGGVQSLWHKLCWLRSAGHQPARGRALALKLSVRAPWPCCSCVFAFVAGMAPCCAAQPM